jgi:hypothetical protein
VCCAAPCAALPPQIALKTNQQGVLYFNDTISLRALLEEGGAIDGMWCTGHCWGLYVQRSEMYQRQAAPYHLLQSAQAYGGNVALNTPRVPLVAAGAAFLSSWKALPPETQQRLATVTVRMHPSVEPVIDRSAMSAPHAAARACQPCCHQGS